MQRKAKKKTKDKVNDAKQALAETQSRVEDMRAIVKQRPDEPRAIQTASPTLALLLALSEQAAREASTATLDSTRRCAHTSPNNDNEGDITSLEPPKIEAEIADVKRKLA